MTYYEKQAFLKEYFERELRGALNDLREEKDLGRDLSTDYHTPTVLAQSAFNFWSYTCITTGDYCEWQRGEQAQEMRELGLTVPERV